MEGVIRHLPVPITTATVGPSTSLPSIPPQIQNPNPTGSNVDRHCHRHIIDLHDHQFLSNSSPDP
uniref:Uncharacterized protein n=1 Tax=Oryza nivara TaxID=4536 RepID=A0A0E0IVG0_ORYNI